MSEYCGNYCEHNATGVCPCGPCLFIRTNTGFQHGPGCERAGQIEPPLLPERWCTSTCPRQQTHMMSDCDCGGAAREFAYLRGERETEMLRRPRP